MGSQRMRRLSLGERKECGREKEREGMVVVKGGKERGLYKDGWVRVMEVFAKTCIIKK